MSGMMQAHDLTYRLLGSILRFAGKSVVWTTSSLSEVVLSSLDSKTKAEIISKDQNKHREVKRIIYYAKRKGYIDSELRTTAKGEKKLAELSFKQITFSDNWDGKWRMVMFDVPEHLRSQRNQIRRLIKELGFFQLQQSVWIHPLPCLEQFEAIRNAYEIESGLLLIEANDFKDAAPALKHFKKLYPGL